MKMFNVLLLVGAACLGTIYYQRYSAVSNIASDVSLKDTPAFSSQPVSSHRQSRLQSNFGGGTYGNTSSSPAIGRIGPGFHAGGGDAEKRDLSPDVLALMDAAAKGEAEKVRKLLEKQVNINSRDNNRRTPLIYAAWNGRDDVCTLLINAGANVKAQDNNGFSAIDYAAGRGQIETLQLLFSRTAIEDTNNALQYATIIRTVYSGDPVYLPAGKLSSVNRISPEGASPLHMSAGNGFIALAQELIKRGAEINLPNREHQTPLHWAAWNNQVETIAFLVEKGADLSSKDTGGNTPLMLATQHNALQAVTMLLQKGAPKKVMNKQGKTALMIAEENHFQEIAKLLQ